MVHCYCCYRFSVCWLCMYYMYIIMLFLNDGLIMMMILILLNINSIMIIIIM